MQRLKTTLERIDGHGYPAYKQIRGSYRFDGFTLEIVHVQGDPFAAPSRCAIRAPLAGMGLDPGEVAVPARRIGAEDALLRSFGRAAKGEGRRRGSGRSGAWGVVRLGQEMLPRTGAEIAGGELRVRFTVGLPARGRRILGRQAAEMLLDELPSIVRSGLLSADLEMVRAHADCAEDQTQLRSMLASEGWVAFIADGALLPRRSGVDDRPLKQGAVPWVSPAELEVEIELPHRGRVRGAAIPEGVTLICGGGYHGKSTLLQALARAVFDHIPGDGRELCSARSGAVSVRAEDGRSVCAVNISAFIDGLPDGRDTARFNSENASGSTSQAANIVEALEMGATCLLIDEDTSATNFMVRDRRMQELVSTGQEPITPFVDRVRGLSDGLGTSSILVVGGSGDYFEVADLVVVMEGYRPRVATAEARSIAERHPSERLQEARPALCMPVGRVPLRPGFDPSRGRKRERVRARQTRAIAFGEEEIDIAQVAQVVDDGQARTIGDWLLSCARGAADGERSIREICERLVEVSLSEGLSATTAAGFGDRVLPRSFEMAAAMNRLRSLEIRADRGAE